MGSWVRIPPPPLLLHMSLFSFSKKTNKCLGIDIGTTSIKVVEIINEKEKLILKNYGISSTKSITGRTIWAKAGGSFSAPTDAIAETIKLILEEAGIKTKRSVFAIPDFSSFFTSFKVPKMKKSEVESAIQYQARQRVPLPLNEVTLDWQLTNLIEKNNKELVEVLLLAVPNEIINTYRLIAKKTGLEMGTLDAETFGLARVLGEEDNTIMVVDIGDQSTKVNIIENKIPKHSNSFQIAGKDFTKNVAIFPEVNYNGGEAMNEVSDKIKKSLAEDLANKIKGVSDAYRDQSGKKIKKVFLTGGGVKFKEIKTNLSKNFSVELAKPFKNLQYPEILEPAIGNLSPLCTIAIGMAMEGLNNNN